jgi:beta-lactamase class A
MLLSLDLIFANLLIGYLSDAALAAYCTTAGITRDQILIPLEADLPRMKVYDNSTKALPGLVVAASTESQSRDLRHVHVVFALHYQEPAMDADNPREAHAQTMAAIEAHLRRQPAFYDYLAATDEAQRQGWQLRRSPVVDSVGSDVIDGQRNLHMIPLKVTFGVLLAPPQATGTSDV